MRAGNAANTIVTDIAIKRTVFPKPIFETGMIERLEEVAFCTSMASAVPGGTPPGMLVIGSARTMIVLVSRGSRREAVPFRSARTTGSANR